MADLKDLKITKAERTKQSEAWETDAIRDDYPYGLSIHIDETTMEKLGLTDKDFDAGQPVTVTAEGFISEDRVSSVNGKVKRCLSIQFRKMAVDQDASGESLATALYGDK